MCKIDDKLWWHPDYGFFSLEFYFKGDNSKKGFSPSNPLTLSQRTEKEVNFIIQLLRPKQGATFLDCPCGYGRHLIALAKRGYKVTGIDINRDFLELGIKEAAKLSLNGHAQFIEQEMLNMDIKDSSFHFAINMFTSLGFYESDEDNQKVLTNFAKLLKPKGKLLLHFDYNATRIINHKYFRGDENLSRRCFQNNTWYDLIVEEKYDNRKKRLAGSWTLINGERMTRKYSFRIYSNEELTKLLTAIGFKSVKFFDPNNKFFTDNSRETIVIATK